MNLHHRLHADARDKKNRVDVSGWSSEHRAAWSSALEVYARELAQRDLRTGKDMTIISGRLSGAGNSLASLGLSDDHRRALEGVAPGYRARLWPDDDKRNRAWIEDVTWQGLEGVKARICQPQNRRLAMAAPCASEPSLAQTTSGSTPPDPT